MDYRNASADMVLQALSDASGVPIIKDPTLTATITLHSPGRLSLNDAFSMLDVALKMKNFELGSEGKFLTVVPKGGGATVAAAPPPGPPHGAMPGGITVMGQGGMPGIPGMPGQPGMPGAPAGLSSGALKASAAMPAPNSDAAMTAARPKANLGVMCAPSGRSLAPR